MPQASRRRKAAKKKKVNEAKINPSSDAQQGSDDLKSQDERGSDAGEFSDFDGAGLVKPKEDIVVKIDRKLKSQESYDGKHDNSDYVSAEESNHGNASPDATSTQEVTTSEYFDKSSDPAPAEMTLNIENTPYNEVDSSVKTDSTGNEGIEKLAVALVEVDLVMEENDVKLRPFSEENAIQKDYDSKSPNSSYGSPIPESTYAIEHGSDFPECSEHQPLLASRPPVQKTSWLNCCGLFEMLGSNK